MFDFDFTFAGDAEGDQAFVRALERSGGATYLAVFAQGATAGELANRSYNVPLSNFARHSWAALVNVRTDTRGFVRHYPYGAMIDDEFVMSAGALIANQFQPDVPTFEIDFSVRPLTIPVVSAKDVMKGTFPGDVFSGRSVIIGASAVELSDQLTVPVWGSMAGPLVHVLAVETLVSGRAIRWLRIEWMGVGLVVALSLLSFVGRTAPVLCIGGVAGTLFFVELAALSAFDRASIMTPTAILYPALLTFTLAKLAKSIRTSDLMLMATSAEARNTPRLLERVFDDGMDGVVILGSDGAVLRHSASAEKMFGLGEDGSLNLPDRLRRAEPLPKSAPRQTYEVHGANGHKMLEYRATVSQIERPAKNGDALHQDKVTTLVLRDITQLREQEREIAYLSNYDDRTGALRRIAFLAFLALRLENRQNAIVFVLGLDRMKTVNVTLGRAVGDAILKEVVARIEQSPLHLSAPARLGGTSFAVYTETAADLGSAHQMAQTLCDEIGDVYRLADANAQLAVRVGYTTVPHGSETTAEAALDQAAEAIDAAQASGQKIAEYDQTA